MPRPSIHPPASQPALSTVRRWLRRYGLSSAMLLFSGLLLAGIWLMVELLVCQERERGVQAVMRDNSNLARVIEGHASYALDALDTLAQTAASDFVQHGADWDVAAFLARYPALPVRQLLVRDPQGKVLLHWYPPGTPEPVLSTAREDRNAPFLGLPVATPTGWLVSVRQPLYRADGPRMGTLSLAVDPSYFLNYYQDLQLGQQSVVTLAGLDGTIRSRLSQGQYSSGQDVSQLPAFQQVLRVPDGSFMADKGVDSTPRIYAYRTLSSYGVYVLVGSAEVEALADVNQRAYRYRWAAAGASGLIALFTALLVWLGLRQQKNNAALRANDRFLHTLTDIIPGMVSYWNTDLHCCFANQEYFNWFGKQPQVILGQHISVLLGPGLYQRNLPHIQAALRGERQQFERCMAKQDGSQGTTWVHYVPDYYRGEVRGFAVWSADLTPIRQTQHELERLYASVRVAAIAFECQEGMVVTDAQRVILQVNQAFIQMTGFGRDEVVGRQGDVLKSLRHDSQFDAALWSEVHSLGGWQGQFWHRHQSRPDFPVQATVTAVTDSVGTITHYVFTLVDASDQLQREAQRLYDERRHREALVREVHHRIKNNLQGIVGLLRQFEHSAFDSRTVFDHLLTQAISQVQSIAVIHGLQGANANEQVNIQALVSAIAQALQSLRQTPVVVQIPPDWPAWTLAEPEAVPIALVLNELILNAMKHSTPAQQDIHIALSHDGTQLCIGIVNPGRLDPVATSAPQAHLGMDLVASLMPRQGAQLTQEQCNGTICTVRTRLTLMPPVIIFPPCP
jgi:PAS domain S-box-containing protein